MFSGGLGGGSRLGPYRDYRVSTPVGGTLCVQIGYRDFLRVPVSPIPLQRVAVRSPDGREMDGINTAILSGEGGGNHGIGFAIPVDMAHNVMNQIVEHGKVIRGYLGVHIQDVTPDLAKQFGLNQGGGVQVEKDRTHAFTSLEARPRRSLRREEVCE